MIYIKVDEHGRKVVKNPAMNLIENSRRQYINDNQKDTKEHNGSKQKEKIEKGLLEKDILEYDPWDTL